MRGGWGQVFERDCSVEVGNPIKVVELEAVNTTSEGKSFKKTKGIKINQSPGLVAGLAQFICLKHVKFSHKYHSHLFYQV